MGVWSSNGIAHFNPPSNFNGHYLNTARYIPPHVTYSLFCRRRSRIPFTVSVYPIPCFVEQQLFFVSPWERPWHQYVLRRKTLVIAHNLRVFPCIQNGTSGFTHKGCVLKRLQFGTLSDFAVVLEMRQCIQFLVIFQDIPFNFNCPPLILFRTTLVNLWTITRFNLRRKMKW